MLDHDIDPEFDHKVRLLLFGLGILVVGGIWICRKHWKMACVLGACVFLYGFIAIPRAIPARGMTHRVICIRNLEDIQEAKMRWATEHSKQKTDIPADSDLFGAGLYVKEKPKCPAGGTYFLGAVGTQTRCSLAERGHTLGGHD